MPTHPRQESSAGLSRERLAAIQTELSAILRSSHFSGSKRCQDFLEFIVRQALDGNYDYLTERFLGAELFGRPINYETSSDSIVRVRANDVRRRLAQFYSSGHVEGPVTIELVSGSYIPEFHWHQSKTVETPPTNLSHHESPEPTSTKHPSDSFRPEENRRGHTRPYYYWTVIGLAAALTVGWYMGWQLRKQAFERALSPTRYASASNDLWSGFLGTDHQTDVVLSDVSFQILQDLGKRSFTLDDYLYHNYLSQLQAQNHDPNMRTILDLIASKNFGNSSEFRLAERIRDLDRMSDQVHIYNSRDYSSTLVGQDNVILIGARYSNPWQQMFESELNFTPSPGLASGAVINKAPKHGERPSYGPSFPGGYCVVAYLPSPSRTTKIMLIEGTSSEATEAGGDFLLSENKLADFRQMLHVDKLPYFEVLLQTSQARGTPIAATVVAYRIH